MPTDATPPHEAMVMPEIYTSGKVAASLPAKRRRGFTLMETVLVIATGLGLVVGGMAFFRHAEVSRGATETLRLATALSAEIIKKYPGGVGAHGDLSAQSLRATSLLPDAVFDRVALAADMPPMRQFIIDFPGIDPAVCARLAPDTTGRGGRNYDETLGNNIQMISCTTAMGLRFVYSF